MAGTTITVGGVAITDVTTYRAELASVRAKLAALYTGFDPAHPEPLFAHEAEIVDLVNNAERLREIIDRWDQAETKRANILAAWNLVRAYTGGGA